MQTTKIYYLKNLDNTTFKRLKAAQMESAKIWNACKDLHLEARKANQPWPNQNVLQSATKGRAELHSQSIQMVCAAFIANVDATRTHRKQGHKQFKYPYHTKTFYPVAWPAQAVKIKDGKLVLPMGKGRQPLVLGLGIEQIGAVLLVWNDGFELHIKQPVEAEPAVVSARHAAIDLGEIHLGAVTTNTGAGLVVSGRGIRAVKRYRQKSTGKIQRRLAKCKQGSRRHKKLLGAKRRIASQTRRQVKDLRHKATRRMVEFCQTHGVSQVYIGNPDGIRNKDCGHAHNDRMAKWEYGKDIDYLSYKLKLSGITVVTGTERGTSSHCPVCDHRHKPKNRTWHCKQCEFTGHRDLVGSVNMHKLGFGQMVPFPSVITYLRPFHLRRSSRPDTGLSRLVRPPVQVPDTVRAIA